MYEGPTLNVQKYLVLQKSVPNRLHGAYSFRRQAKNFRLSWKPKFDYRVQKGQSLVYVMRHMNPVQILPCADKSVPYFDLQLLLQTFLW